jgi:hypothetical protein
MVLEPRSSPETAETFKKASVLSFNTLAADSRNFAAKGIITGEKMTGHSASTARGARIWRWAFLTAGAVGIVEIAPLYFYEAALGRTDPPAVTHPEFYYGFLGVVLAWQVAFLIISRDPVRYRPLLPAILMEKILYIVSTFALFAAGRIHAISTLAGATLDVVWLSLFIIAWRVSGTEGAVYSTIVSWPSAAPRSL